MYICDICNTPFDRPGVTVDLKDGYRSETCPICGEGSFSPADECPRCGEWKPVSRKLCHDCTVNLVSRFCDFADELTEDEEDALDELLDGNSVKDRRKWA
jgi:hypothetical protein